MNSTKKVLTVGAKFGEVYLNSFSRHVGGLELGGLMATGSGRAYQLAKTFQIPLYKSVDEVPDGFHIACVVVRSTIVGGEGSKLAEAFIRRGMHVIQEHPVHPNEVARLQKLAFEHGVLYWINSFYCNARSGRVWLRASEKLKATLTMGANYAQLCTSRQLLFSSLDLLLHALGDCPAPFDCTAAVRIGPFDRFSFTWNGTPVDISLQNYMDSSDPDQHSLISHQCQLCWPEGHLTLAGSYGPVFWTPSFFDGNHHDTMSTVSSRMMHSSSFRLPTVSMLHNAPADWKTVYTEDGPEAVSWVLASLVSALQGHSIPARFSPEYQLSIATLWQRILRHVGPPLKATLKPPLHIDPLQLIDPATGHPGVI